MDVEYYTLSSYTLASYLLASVCLGACLAFVGILIAAGVRAGRRDRRHIRSWSNDVRVLQDVELRRGRRRLSVAKGPYAAKEGE